jgi:hypothetical protein
MWGFRSLSPESPHRVVILFSDRGLPVASTYMNGHGSHTCSFRSAEGRRFRVEFHFETLLGHRRRTDVEAADVIGSYAGRERRRWRSSSHAPRVGPRAGHVLETMLPSRKDREGSIRMWRGFGAAPVVVAVIAVAASAALAETAPKRKGGFTAEPIVVAYADEVTPDAELAAFLVELSKATQGVEARPDLFAAPVRVFVRSKDPLAPLVERKPAKLWNLLSSRMKEAGDQPPPGSPDRDGFLARLAADLGGDEPLGRVEGLGDMVCLPAAFTVDRTAVGAVAVAIGAKGTPGLRFSTEPVPFRTFAPGPTTIEVPAGTLFVRRPLADGAELPRDPQFVLSDGRSGSVAREVVRSPSWRSLRRHHTCFGKVDGRWKITAVVFAGLD